jgi:hypothetical protein
MYICEFCDKEHPTIHSLNRHLERDNLCKMSLNILVPKINNQTSIKCEYVYLLHEKKLGDSIYKIGRTCQLNKPYPKNNMLLLQTICNNCITCDHQIMNMFKQKYIHRVDIGSKYFEGNFKEMQRDIFNIVMTENETKV